MSFACCVHSVVLSWVSNVVTGGVPTACYGDLVDAALWAVYETGVFEAYYVVDPGLHG